MDTTVPWEELFKAASEVRAHAYAPYSNFQVGAALLCEDGTIVAGCNVENSSYGLSICAERNAIARAVVEGRGRLKLVAVAVVVDSREPCPPCGACRQVMVEFGGPELPVRCRNLRGQETVHLLEELLPHAFTRSFL